MRLQIVLINLSAILFFLTAGCGGQTTTDGSGGNGNGSGGTTGTRVAKSVQTKQPAPARQVFRAKAEDLKHTIVTAHLREPHAPGQSLLWCASMQMAWDEAARHFGGTMPLQGAPLMGQTLDEHLVVASDLDPASYVALGGFRRDGIETKIREAIATKFGAGEAPSLLAPGGGHPDDLIAYAYLLKNLEFETPFLPNTDEPLKFDGKAVVNSYGVWPGLDTDNYWDIAGQISIWTYTEGGEFIVELKTKSEQDRVIFAQIDPGTTLKDDVDKVLPQLKGKPEAMTYVDRFKAPAMDFDLLRTYREVIRRKILKPCIDTKSNEKEYEITDARQTFQFKIDERGAILKSEAVVMAAPSAAPPGDYTPPPPPKPKRLIFDKPFLILLLRKDAKMPYFALWVDNAELLQEIK